MKYNSGFTLLEMLVALTLLMILASAVMPLAKNKISRQRELELRRGLRTMRLAIDDYKRHVDKKKITPTSMYSYGYPERLESLLEEHTVLDTGAKIRFMRKVPVDPFTHQPLWGLRSISDSPNSFNWGGGNVYDVYSLAPGIGSDGIPYREW